MKKMAKKLYDEHGNEVKQGKLGGCLKLLGVAFIVITGLVFFILISDDGTENTAEETSGRDIASSEVANSDNEDLKESIIDESILQESIKESAESVSIEESIKEEESESISIEEEIVVDNTPQEYKNALKKGQTYADMMHMSKQGVYDQLTSEYGEGFPADAAQYAIDNIDVDWKENALKKATSYYENMAMSKEGVYEQLVSAYGEQFTAEEAQYAVDNLD